MKYRLFSQAYDWDHKTGEAQKENGHSNHWPIVSVLEKGNA